MDGDRYVGIENDYSTGVRRRVTHYFTFDEANGEFREVSQ